MFPVLLSLGRFHLYTYGVLVATGVLLGLWLFEREAKRLGLDGKRAVDLAFWSALFGFLCSRALFVLLHLPDYGEEPLRALKFWEGGLVLYGGVIPGVALALLLARRWGMPLGKVLDASPLGLSLGFALGRLGCFFAGCCYGGPTELPWGVTFSDPRSLAPLGVKVHPTQLYESLFFWGAFAFFLIRRPKGTGRSLFALTAAYGAFRFLNEFLRGDPRATLWGLSHNQWVMLGVLALSLFMLSYKRKDA